MRGHFTNNAIQVVYKTYLQEQYHRTLLDLHGGHQQTAMRMEHLETTLSDAHQDTLQCSQEQLQ